MNRGRVASRLFVLLWLVFLAGWPANAAAQGVVIWSEPFNVSSSETGSTHPAIVTDVYGYVHVFWSEEMGGPPVTDDEPLEGGNTILYRRWDGHSWGEPCDILAVANDNNADFVSVAVDDTNQFHLVWIGTGNLYYSTAPAMSADSPWAWSTPQLLSAESAGSAYGADVAVDSQGNVHVVYTEGGSQPGVLHATLPRDGTSWTQPIRISDSLRPTEAGFTEARLIVDASDRLHAVWGTANPNGYAQAVYYARGEGSGRAWDPPVLMADSTIDTGFTGTPSLLAHGRDELLLIHVAETTKGRIERTSIDGGRTWSEPRTIITSMEGLNSFLVPLTDGLGHLHLVINMRPTADQRVGIYYAPRARSDWAPIQPVAVEALYGSSAHYTDAIVRLGNQIHVVWTQLGSGEIWHVRGEISGVPQIPALALPTQAPMVTATATAPSVEPTMTPGATRLPSTAPPTASSFQPLLLSALASVVIVLPVLLWARTRSR